MKTFKRFLLDEMQQHLMLEMPHISLPQVDLEFELRVGPPDSVDYNEFINYLRQWYWGYSFIPKVKDFWTNIQGTGGKREELLNQLKDKGLSDILFTSDERFKDKEPGAIEYHFDGNQITKKVPGGFVKVIPWKISGSKDQETFLSSLEKPLVKSVIQAYLNQFKKSFSDFEKDIEVLPS